MKGIILAGGKGTRLYPSTMVLSKQLLPLYDKPMIYYPLSILMLSEIREVLIISSEKDLPLFKSLLGDGSHLGMKFEYKVQKHPNGIAEAFIIAEDFIGNDSVCLVLGDNVFYGQGLSKILLRARKNLLNAVVFAVQVRNPSEFGVVEIKGGKAISIEEKPNKPKSNFAVPGLYFYPNNVVSKAKSIMKSNRGELEITSINQLYLNEGILRVEILGRGIAWLDTGSAKSMLMAAEFIHVLQERQNLYVACIEEISYRKGYINLNQLKQIAKINSNSDYSQYLMSIVIENEKLK